eukprot:EG_transcript_50739
MCGREAQNFEARVHMDAFAHVHTMHMKHRVPRTRGLGTKVVHCGIVSSLPTMRLRPSPVKRHPLQVEVVVRRLEEPPPQAGQGHGRPPQRRSRPARGGTAAAEHPAQQRGTAPA